jgi:tRNA-splicing ligase RtcB
LILIYEYNKFMITKQNLKKITNYLYEIPKEFRSDMRVPVRVYTDDKMLDSIVLDYKKLEK